MIFKYNDYELLYLISEHSESALEIMYEKYRPLIYARIRDFKIAKSSVEDFFQEGLFVLHICINRFNDIYKKSFTRYFDICLQRKYLDLLRSNRNYFYNTDLYNSLDILGEKKVEYTGVYVEAREFEKKLSKFERVIFQYKYIEDYSIKQMAEVLNIDCKKIYNALSRIKIKLDEHKENN